MKKILIIFIGLVFLNFIPDEDIISVLREKSTNYFNKYKRAKLELFFNQPKYSVGDTVQFRIAYLSASDLKPVVGKQLVHICLFDQFGKKVLTRWAKTGNGFSTHKMVIPSNISVGKYLLVAYTDWMKNFDQQLFFKKQFEVSGKYSLKDRLPKDTIIFFPEGGSLISNVENNVAVHYQGSHHNAQLIIRENEKELTTIALLNDSVSLFKFKPQINFEYSGVLVNGDKSIKFSLPKVNTAGIALQVDVSENKLTVNLESSSINNSNTYLAVFNNAGLVYQKQCDFSTDQKATVVFPANLPKGVLQLTVFDSKFNLLASRVIHNGGQPLKEISFDNFKDSYSTRQKITWDIKIKDKDGYSIPESYSCRIINSDLFSSIGPLPMDYLTFQSDISNTFPLNRNDANQQTIQNYLLTQTCPWFDWNKLVNNEKSQLTFRNQQYLILSGKATFAKNGKNVPDSTLVMMFLENSLQGFEAYTNSKGLFSFPLVLSVDQLDNFFYSASLKGRDMDDVTIKMFDNDSSLLFFAKPWLQDDTYDPYGLYAGKTQVINNSYLFFGKGSSSSDSINEPNRFIEEELNGADLTVQLSDYLVMPTMEEVTREILKAVEYRKVNGRNVFRVYTTGKEPTNFATPLFVIDGQLTKNPLHYLSLKPSDVISIKVVKDSRKLIALGNLGVNGVIIVKTKLEKPSFEEKHIIDFAGILKQAPPSFSKNLVAQAPDLRPCLFWSSKSGVNNEEIVLDFQASDDVGKFKIQVSGLTDTGIPFYTELPFQVKYAGN